MLVLILFSSFLAPPPPASEENRHTNERSWHTSQHQEPRPQLLRCAGEGAGSHLERPMGPFVHDHGGDCRPHVQRGGLLRNHADDLEAHERPRQKLAARVQGTGKLCSNLLPAAPTRKGT